MNIEIEKKSGRIALSQEKFIQINIGKIQHAKWQILYHIFKQYWGGKIKPEQKIKMQSLGCGRMEKPTNQDMMNVK